MGRLVAIVVIAVLVLWLIKRALAKPKQDPTAGGAPQGEPQSDLVSCAHCGVNLPRAEARSAGGRHYCSEEHWRLGPRDD